MVVLKYLFGASVILILSEYVRVNGGKVFNFGALKNKIKDKSFDMMEKIHPSLKPPKKSKSKGKSMFGHSIWKSLGKGVVGIKNILEVPIDVDIEIGTKPSKTQPSSVDTVRDSVDKMNLAWQDLKQKVKFLKGDMADSAADAFNKIKFGKAVKPEQKVKEIKYPPPNLTCN